MAKGISPVAASKSMKDNFKVEELTSDTGSPPEEATAAAAASKPLVQRAAQEKGIMPDAPFAAAFIVDTRVVCERERRRL